MYTRRKDFSFDECEKILKSKKNISTKSIRLHMEYRGDVYEGSVYCSAYTLDKGVAIN